MLRRSLHEFLEAQTYWGSKYEKFTLVLILLNVVTFSLGTVRSSLSLSRTTLATKTNAEKDTETR